MNTTPRISRCEAASKQGWGNLPSVLLPPFYTRVRVTGSVHTWNGEERKEPRLKHIYCTQTHRRLLEPSPWGVELHHPHRAARNNGRLEVVWRQLRHGIISCVKRLCPQHKTKEPEASEKNVCRGRDWQSQGHLVLDQKYLPFLICD